MSLNPLFEQISHDIQKHSVVLYMKGTKQAPLCGFSGFVVQVLNRLGISYYDVNILDDPDLRQAIKDFSDWPTIPQLYVQGEFVGGADIVREMLASGELINLLTEKGILQAVDPQNQDALQVSHS